MKQSYTQLTVPRRRLRKSPSQAIAETRRDGNRRRFDLPVTEEIHELPAPDRLCPCCGVERPEIGEDRSAEYDLIPAHVVKIVHVRKKYGPCRCEYFQESEQPEVVTAPRPARIVPGSDFTNRTIALFVTVKYQDAIPFYRMEKMLSRSGLIVSRAGLCKLALSVGKALGGPHRDDEPGHSPFAGDGDG